MEKKEIKKVEAVEEKDVFLALDQLDEEMILAELTDQIKTSDWVYCFSDKTGKEHYELTKAGIDEAIRRITQQEKTFTREYIESITETDKDIKVVVRVERWVIDKEGRQHLLDSRIGAKRQPKLKYFKSSNKFQEDPFYFEACVQKAIRNANKRMIPESLKQEIFQLAKNENRVLFLNVEWKEVPSLPEKSEESEQPKQTEQQTEPYRLSAKQQKMVFAVGRNKGLTPEELKEMKELLFGGRIVEYENREQFDEFLTLIRSFATQKDGKAFLETLRNKKEVKDDKKEQS